MSSWDRSRAVPWSRAIPVMPATATGETEDVDLMKERVWRDLSREAANEAKELEKRKQQSSMEGEGLSSSSSSSSGAMMDDATRQQQQQQSTLINNNNNNTKKEEVNILGYVGRPYQTSDLLRNVAFGATIGSITGMCFGFMDSIRSASSSKLLKTASRSAQGKFVFQGTYRSGMFFGGFFGAFHTVKYATRVLVDPG
eukprot:CAMPEP_0196132082 /NCGR_PEP_ID=MMETSP0910-20130528/1830_1 /TAXON_ID=49265 /ORGANISM="Thalassiosira rotula, Strain GSO102" /LENGTH=197 /DNA_ID=CAMNT_0041391631 /DNA_START=94 /DNA_END=683 /DNA_ORIENTATION=-